MSIAKLISLPVTLMLIPLACVQCALADQAIVSEGNPKGCIVVPAGTGEGPVLTAAKDLCGYLKTMSGADIPIRDDSQVVEGFRILIGPTKLEAVSPEMLDPSNVGIDGFIIHSIPNGVLIAGRIPQGTANGVYHFAEEVLGVHWYSVEDDAPTCPAKKTIEIPSLEWTVKPDSMLRGQYFSFQQAPEYLAGGSSLPKKLEANRDRWWTFNRLWCFPAETGHAFSAMVPSTLFQEHPEYFPYLDYTFEKGSRIRITRPSPDGSFPTWPFKAGRYDNGEATQRCLSNMAVQKLAAKWTAQQLAADPALQFATLSANDGPWWCACDKCKKMGRTDSHRNLAFCNAVAKANESKYADRGYIFYAYWDTLKAPTDMEAHRSLVPMIAALWQCRIHPISADCPDSVVHRTAVDGWDQIADRISARPYVTPGPFTFPGVLTMAEEMRYYRDHNSLGVLREYQFQPGVNWALMVWAEARLLWDADQDPVQLRRQFIEGYYGSASAETIVEVYDALERGVWELKRDWPADDGTGLHSLKGKDVLQPLIAKCSDRIQAARDAAKNEPDVFRLRVERDMNALLNGTERI